MTRRTRARSRGLLAAATALTAATALGTAGCSWAGSETHNASRSYTAGAKGERINALEVDTHAGDITVKAAEPGRTSVGVTEDSAYGKTKPHTEHSVSDGTLRLTADDCSGGDGACEVTYTLSVPASLPLRLKTGGGSLVVRGTSGPVHATSGGGSVRMLDSEASEVAAETGGGSLTGTFATAPDTLRYETGGGNATVRLPRGPYAVDATTGGGKRTVTVDTDPAAEHRITLRSGGGNVSVLRADAD
ncbi:hypothetical protein [Streptomyces sp. PU-14G]|uniref:hypothetical protein n=1 Tax=Streptomyces sp. PU-14G TaxID=2800808 RepID=UPI0034DF1239